MEVFYRWAFLIVIAWYVGASVIHYWSHRSLWNDELAVLDSIRLMKPAELFLEPLRTSQAFPHFYLFCIQSFAKPFGNSIWSLRFFPFVCMMLAFGVWLRVARYELKAPLEYLTFALCWIASVPLIYYSAELKQYSLDVMVSGLFVLFLSSQDRLSRQPNVWLYGFLLALLPATVLFSYPACFFLIFPLWNICLKFKQERTGLKWIMIYMCSVVIFTALSYQFDIRLRPVEAVTNGFNDYFISLHSLGDFFQTFGEGINNLFSRWFVELPKVFRKLARFFMFFGLIHLFLVFLKNIHKAQWKACSISTVALVVFFELAVAGVFVTALLVMLVGGLASFDVLFRKPLATLRSQ